MQLRRAVKKHGHSVALLVLLGLLVLLAFKKNDEGTPLLSAAAKASIERLANSSALPGADAHHDQREYPDVRTEVPLSAQDQTVFAAQWQAAVSAAARLDTPKEAIAAGYMPARAEDRAKDGVSHWVKWELVEEPFDPARPSMLLFSTRDGVEKLAGFSYTVQGTNPPEGFAGPNDEWHRHWGLCILNGQGLADSIPKEECPGDWLPAGDLWMLHAWVVPGYANSFGRFSMSAPPRCPVEFGCPTEVLVEAALEEALPAGGPHGTHI